MLQIDLSGAEPRVPGCVGGLDQTVDLRGLEMDPMTPVFIIGGIGLAVWLAMAGLASWGAYRVVKKITEPSRGLRGLGINDTDRENFVDNEESLYLAQRRSRLSKRNFVRQNRDFIDELIKRVNTPRQKQWYDYR